MMKSIIAANLCLSIADACSETAKFGPTYIKNTITGRKFTRWIRVGLSYYNYVIKNVVNYNYIGCL